MIKKQKKQSKYVLHNKEFTTFKEMKTYKLIKQERRVLCIKTYDIIEKYKKWIEKQQLKLFKDG